MVNPWRNYQNASKQKRQALLVPLAGLAVFVVFYAITRFVSVPLCPIWNLFGVPCVGCGLTRAFIAILHFDFGAATEYHALSIPLFLWLLTYSVLCVSDVLLGRNDLENVKSIFKKPLVLVFLFWVFVVFLYSRYR